MFDKLTSWWTNFANSPDKAGHKIVLLIVLFIILIMVDGQFKFSDNYFINSKLTNLEKINSILRTNNDSVTTIKLKLLKNEILDSRNSYFSFLKSTIIYSYNTTTARPINAKPIDNVIMFFCSTWFILLIMLAIPFVALVNAFENLPRTLYALILGELLIATLGAFVWFVLKQIPLVFGQPVLNYILGIIVNITIAFIAMRTNPLSPRKQRTVIN